MTAMTSRASAQSKAFFVWMHAHRHVASEPSEVWAAAADWGATDALLRSGRLDIYVGRLEQLMERLDTEEGNNVWEIFANNAWLAEIGPLAADLRAVLRAQQIADEA